VAALTAAGLGFEVVLFEQAEKVAGPGGSWVLNPNGLRVLEALSLMADVAPKMVPSTRVSLESTTGTTLLQAQYSCATIACAQLLETLLSVASQRAIKINLAHRLVEVQQQPNCIDLGFENGSGYAADVVIGGDGIHSRVRQESQINAHMQPLARSYLRGVVPVPAGRSYPCERWSRDGRRFGIDPLTEDRCGFYASIPRGSWGKLRDRSFSEWQETWEDFGEDVSRVIKCLSGWEEVSYDEPFHLTNSSWSASGNFLVGDAAHAQAPNVGQGANSAMVDSLVLIRLLHQMDNVEMVQKQYEKIRRNFVSRTQRLAQLLSWLESWSSPIATATRDASLRTANRSSLLQRWTKQYLAGSNRLEEHMLQ